MMTNTTINTAAPTLVLLGNLLVDDIVLADGRTLLGEPGGALLHAALAASLWDARSACFSTSNRNRSAAKSRRARPASPESRRSSSPAKKASTEASGPRHSAAVSSRMISKGSSEIKGRRDLPLASGVVLRVMAAASSACLLSGIGARCIPLAASHAAGMSDATGDTSACEGTSR